MNYRKGVVVLAPVFPHHLRSGAAVKDGVAEAVGSLDGAAGRCNRLTGELLRRLAFTQGDFVRCENLVQHLGAPAQVGAGALLDARGLQPVGVCGDGLRSAASAALDREQARLNRRDASLNDWFKSKR